MNNLDNIDNLNFEELNKIKNNLFREQQELFIQQQNISKNLKIINTMIAKQCEKEFTEHLWIKEKENCMYGETYIYCSRCKKDKFSNTIYN